MIDLTGQVALVTGGSRGIGRACAIALARRGLRVAVHYHRDREAAIECAAMLDGAGGPHPVLQADLTQPEEARSLVDAVTRDCGRLDVVVNNAGIYELHSLDSVGWDEWQRAWRHTLDANLLGPANVSYWAAYERLVDEAVQRILWRREDPDQVLPPLAARLAALRERS